MATKRKAKPSPRQLPPAAEGLPDPASVVESVEFVSLKGNKYTILKTTETDATDRKPPSRKQTRK